MTGAVSSACFFPLDTYRSLEQLQKMGVLQVELFLNTFQELQPDFLEKTGCLLKRAGMQVVALHPFSSGFEPFFFFSRYPGRFEDGLALYRQFFELCCRWGIPRVIFHGDYLFSSFPEEEYFSRFQKLALYAKEYGVVLSQENVARCKSASPCFLQKMREALKEEVSFTLDLKQARRQGAPLEEFLRAMGPCLDHIHLSGASTEKDCVAPFPETLDMRQLLKSLQPYGFTGNLVIELYRNGFDSPQELVRSVQYVTSFLQ